MNFSNFNNCLDKIIGFVTYVPMTPNTFFCRFLLINQRIIGRPYFLTLLLNFQYHFLNATVDAKMIIKTQEPGQNQILSYFVQVDKIWVMNGTNSKLKWFNNHQSRRLNANERRFHHFLCNFIQKVVKTNLLFSSKVLIQNESSSFNWFVSGCSLCWCTCRLFHFVLHQFRIQFSSNSSGVSSEFRGKSLYLLEKLSFYGAKNQFYLDILTSILRLT